MSRQHVHSRWREEIRFHDEMSHRDRRRACFRDFGLSAKAIDHARNLLESRAPGLLLDVGCGTGDELVMIDATGRRIAAFDLSHALLTSAQSKLSAVAFNGDVSLIQAGAEELPHPADTFDAAFGISVLHHTDISLTLAELFRVVRPGGHLVFVEPLAHNPAARLYRFATPSRHSSSEQPLSYTDLSALTTRFPTLSHREFFLFSVLAAPVSLLRSKRLFQRVLEALHRVDVWLLRRWPILRKYAWITVLHARVVP